ncbi:MAG: hypothetical protein M1839_003190 [Geoglossum umbratile]|nr:MAG: hypothetical protein M1839_003190 [Geoglossum umbratile]
MDPGTVVGAISLGITLCDGIATYCHAWKHQDDEVRSLATLCEGLKQLLQDIEQGVKGSQTLDPNIVEKLNKTLQACTGHSEAVLRLTEKYTVGPAATTWKGKARELAQRLKFPFEKKTLEELKNIMIAFRGNVDIALGLLELFYFMFWDSSLQHQVKLTTESDISMSTQGAVQTLRAESNKNNLTILGEIQTMSGQVSQSSAAVSQCVMTGMDQRLSMLEGSVAQHINNSKSSMEATVTNSSAEIISAFSTQIRQQTMAFASILNEIPEPQRQYSTKTESSKLPISGSSLPRSKKRRRKRDQYPVEQKPSGCKCCPNIGRINSSPSYSWGLGKESEAFVIHKRSCPLWYHSQTVTKYGVNVLLLQRLRVFGSLSISRSPYASIFGCSISQNLTYRAVVPDDAPAFKVLRKYLTTPGFGGCEHYITSCSQDLRAVFQSGQGSPYDTLADGATLAELTRELLELGVEMNLYRERSGFWCPWLEFHSGIFSGYAVHFPKGPVGQFNTHAQNVLEFLFWLMKHDIEIPNPLERAFSGCGRETRPWHGFKIILNALRSYEDFAIATECGVLSTAVLRRDKLAVEKSLDQHPQFLETERNVFRQSPIHLAIGWPDGLKLLLRATDQSLLHRDLDNMCRNRSTPLDYAIAFGCAKSIRLLADADVAFDFDWNLFIGTDSLNPEVSEVVLDIILERFRQLLEFGRQNLPVEKFSSLQIIGFESFDLKARALLNCLRAEGIQLPRKFGSVYGWERAVVIGRQDFWLGFSGFFHQDGIGHSTAMKFFQAGFTNVDSEVEQITPLMNLSAPNCSHHPQFFFSRYFHIVESLVEKGGRLDRQIPSDYINKPPLSNDAVNNYRVIHRIASSSWTGVIFFDSTEVDTVAHLGSSQIWHDILQSNTPDPCICACASGGCRPISLALKSSANSNGAYYSRWYHHSREFNPGWGKILNPRHWKVAVELLFKLTLFLNGLEGEQLAGDVIRFLTFSALGLSHTCCHWTDFPPCFSSPHTNYKMIEVMDPTDVKEVGDEEAELIETLDCLVNGFMKDFRELGIPLSQFLLEKWQETMLVELSIRDEIPKPLREQLEELGVTIYANSSSGDEDESDEEPSEEFDC